MISRSGRLFVALVVAAMYLNAQAAGADWPMWRCDASRSAASPEELPEQRHLQWVREYPPPRPARPGKVYFVSDDGHLYACSPAKVWLYKDKSSWPARGKE